TSNAVCSSSLAATAGPAAATATAPAAGSMPWTSFRYLPSSTACLRVRPTSLSPSSLMSAAKSDIFQTFLMENQRSRGSDTLSLFNPAGPVERDDGLTDTSDLPTPA